MTIDKFISKFKRKGVMGIVLLDDRLVIFKEKGARLGVKSRGKIKADGASISYEVLEYEAAKQSMWAPTKKWLFSRAKILYDPRGKIKALIREKTKLSVKERKWSITIGMVLSKMYSEYAKAWVAKGDLVSAHYCINVALDYLLEALFALNNQLCPDKRFIIHLAKQLKWVPNNFERNLSRILTVELSIEGLKLRRDALNRLWKQMLPKAERVIGAKFDQFKEAFVL